MESGNDDRGGHARTWHDVGAGVSKRLVLIRHAKSDWSDSSLRDFDRPLNKRGNRDAPRMGKLLGQQGVRPDLIISSDALRARITAELIAREVGYPLADIRLSHALYLAAPATLLAALAEVDESLRCVALVAHNPGMTDLANQLSDARIDNLPTSGIFMTELDEGKWSDFGRRQARFAGFLSPKQNLG